MMYFFKTLACFYLLKSKCYIWLCKVERGFTFSIKRTLSKIGLCKHSPSCCVYSGGFIIIKATHQHFLVQCPLPEHCPLISFF